MMRPPTPRRGSTNGRVPESAPMPESKTRRMPGRYDGAMRNGPLGRPCRALRCVRSIKPRAALRGYRRFAVPWAIFGLPLRGERAWRPEGTRIDEGGSLTNRGLGRSLSEDRLHPAAPQSRCPMAVSSSRTIPRIIENRTGFETRMRTAFERRVRRPRARRLSLNVSMRPRCSVGCPSMASPTRDRRAPRCRCPT